jgi:hypothetical protein
VVAPQVRPQVVVAPQVRPQPAPQPAPQGATTLGPKFALGAHLGAGAYKDAYAAAGDPNAVVRVLKNNGNAQVLQTEQNDYGVLAQHGIPVPHIIAKGQINGHIADVIERFDISNRDPQFAAQAPKMLAGAKADLLRIRQGVESGVAIGDLQFLFRPGHAVVNDPLGIVLKEKDPARYTQMRTSNLQLIDSLIQKSN